MRKNQKELAETGDFQDRADIVLHAREHELAPIQFDALRAVDQNSKPGAIDIINC